MSEEPGASIELEWPATDPFKAVGRLVLGGIAARCDLTYDRVDELGIALDALTHGRPSDDRYLLRANVTEDSLMVTLGSFETNPLTDEGVRRVVEALVGAVEAVPSPGSAYSNVRLTLPVKPPESR